MTITTATADALDALATQLSAATAPDPNVDTQLYALIAEPMLTIQNRVAPAGYKYTLNVTNALLLRAKSWYLKALMEIGEANQPYASCGLEFIEPLGFVKGGTSSTGATIGLATCAAICRSWAMIIRDYLANPPV